jgi:hypothetical protein
MDDQPNGRPSSRAAFVVACMVLGAATFVVVFYLAALAVMT